MALAALATLGKCGLAPTPLWAQAREEKVSIAAGAAVAQQKCRAVVKGMGQRACELEGGLAALGPPSPQYWASISRFSSRQVQQGV